MMRKRDASPQMTQMGTEGKSYTKNICENLRHLRITPPPISLFAPIETAVRAR